MKIIRLFYKKCKFEEGCGVGRVIKGTCDVCGEAYYEAAPPLLPLHTKIWLFIVPNFILYWYTQIKWKIKLGKDYHKPPKKRVVVMFVKE